MPNEPDEASENPYDASSVEHPQGDPPGQPLKARTFAASLGLVLVIFLASSAAFSTTCAVGAYAGLQISQAAGAVSEGAMGYGVMTGLTVGIVCSIAVAWLLSVALFRRR